MIKFNLIINYLKIKSFLCNLLVVFFCFLLVSCHKSSGAICNDGSRSYSTGRGTCSWHGGVDHYIDTKEISVPKTAGLIIILGFVGFAMIGSSSKGNAKEK